MGQVLELFETDENETVGVKEVRVPAYQTSDGTIFKTKQEADAHEAQEQFVKNTVKDYQRYNNPFRVGGYTMRGNGDEFVTADHRNLEAYTRYVISQIKG